MSETPENRFSEQDVGAIIRRVLGHATEEDDDTTVSYEDLHEIARGIGIDGRSLDAVLRELRAEEEYQARLSAWYRSRRARFHTGLGLAIALNAIMLVIDLLTPGGPWFYWPLAAAVVVLTPLGLRAYFPTRETVEEAEHRLQLEL